MPAKPTAGTKRKEPPLSSTSTDRPSQSQSQSRPHREPPSTSLSRKRARTHDARHIVTQGPDAALSATGELSIPSFVAAREFEIKALEESMTRSKHALSTRAFQQVPRAMRRRTASHNVKRVPKRLRRRAEREMREDNTPTVNSRTRGKKVDGKERLRMDVAKRVVARNRRSKEREALEKEKKKITKKKKDDGKEADTEKMVQEEPLPKSKKKKKNVLSDPPKPVDSKFTKRQKDKTWLPTHLFHAKRAHMTPPNEPLWRFAIPLSPTEKCYRPTHRASAAKGAVMWDTSYMSTIGLEGVEASLQGLVRSLGVEEDVVDAAGGRKWRAGTRAWEGWLYQRDNEKLPIAPVTVIWCRSQHEQEGKSNPPKKEPKRKMFIRVHPSAFLQLWEEVLKVAKIQRPKVMAEDLRYEIGSIEITGPGATEALLGALRPVVDQGENSAQCPESTWKSLAGLSNSSALPAGALLGFNVSDPRFRHPPQPVEIPTSDEAQRSLAALLASWPPDQSQAAPSLFDRNLRLKAARELLSQKSINRRKAEAGPGAEVSSKETDPAIPVLLFASRVSSKDNSQGTWTVLIPWKCVLPIWYSLMYYPLSTGGNPRFGGLQEKHQVLFEANEPWFPGDHPGTAAGLEWEILERKKRKEEWMRKPKGRRVEYDTLDLRNGEKGEVGKGWACDWEFLLSRTTQEIDTTTQTKNGAVDMVGDKTTDSMGIDRPSAVTSGNAAPENSAPTSTLTWTSTLKPQPSSTSSSSALPTLPPSSTTTGTTGISQPNPAIPPTSTALTTINISLPRGTAHRGARIYNLPENPTHRSQWLSLLSPSSSSNNHKNIVPTPASAAESRDTYPPCPPGSDLIGFVTSGGSFNLREGKGTAVGSVVVGKLKLVTVEGLNEGGDLTACSAATKEILRGDGTFRERERESERTRSKRRRRKIVVVRNSGEVVGRIGIWNGV